MSTMHGNSAAMAARDWAQTLVPYRRASAAAPPSPFKSCGPTVAASSAMPDHDGMAAR